MEKMQVLVLSIFILFSVCFRTYTVVSRPQSVSEHLPALRQHYLDLRAQALANKFKKQTQPPVDEQQQPQAVHNLRQRELQPPAVLDPSLVALVAAQVLAQLPKPKTKNPKPKPKAQDENEKTKSASTAQGNQSPAVCMHLFIY